MAEASIAIGDEMTLSIVLWPNDPRGPSLICYFDTDDLSDEGVISLSMTGLSALLAAVHTARRSIAHQLYAEGWSKRQIGLALAVGRRTIQLWLKEES